MSSLQAAQALFHEGRTAEAIALYQQIIAQNPQCAIAQHELGLIYAQQQNMAAAEQHFLAAVHVEPNNSIFHNHLANIYKINKNYELAKKHYLKALTLNPKFAEVHNNLAGVYSLKNEFDTALHHYAKALLLKPNYIEAHHNLGLLFIKMHKLAEATIQFKNVIRLNPQAFMAHYHLANIYFSQKNFQKAKRHYESVLENDPENIDALNNLGVIYLTQEEPQIAVDYFTKVLALNEDHLGARSNIAATFLQYDRHVNAITHYHELLTHTPEDIEANFNLAVALMSTGNLNEAIAQYEKILSLDENHADSLSNLGAIYLRLNDTTKAQDYFQRAIAIQPNNPIVRYMLEAVTQKHPITQAPNEYIENLFNHYALNYDKHLLQTLHYQIPHHIQQAIISVSNLTHAQWQVLDLGCGTGLTGEVLKPFAKYLVGIDLSIKMLDIARQKHIYDELLLGDFKTLLPKEKKKFDLIVAADVLGYLGDLAIAFKQCSHALVPSGLFVFSIENTNSYPFILQKNARFAHTQQYITELAKENFFDIVSMTSQIGRMHNNETVNVDIVVLRKMGTIKKSEIIRNS